LYIQRLHTDVGSGAHVGKIGNIPFVITGQGHKEPSGGFNAVGGHYFEQPPFQLALAGGRRVRGHITRAAVEQPVIATGGTGIDVLLFNQDGSDTAKGQIPGQAGTCGATADDEHLSLQ
jgi:hypothetical protein